jgi:hypothetical protein
VDRHAVAVGETVLHFIKEITVGQIGSEQGDKQEYLSHSEHGATSHGWRIGNG